MNEDLKKDYDNSLSFWNSAIQYDSEAKEQLEAFLSPDSDNWTELATSEKFGHIICENLGEKENVLDYGCGDGWAGIIIKKSGAKNVKSVDVIENAIETTKYMQKLVGINEGFNAECVSVDWLSTVADETYDGIITSNVLDVVPEETAEGIIKELARIARKDATVIVGLNNFYPLKSIPEKNLEIRDKNHVYLNGILRLVSLTDEEWTAILSKYFTVEKLDYYAWEGEEKETRRIFILKK